MHNLFKLFCFAALSILALPVSAKDHTDAEPLDIGVIPYMSARVLVNSYETMRHYLENVLGRPVHIYTANGFKQFFLNSQKGDYDLVISAAHFARILQKENKFIPLVRYSKGGRGLVMVSRKGNLKTSQDLKGKIIALPDQLSLASIVCMTYLHETGLKAGADFKLLSVPSFESAILAIREDDAQAAVSAPGALVQMKKELRDSVIPIVDTGEYINLIFLSNPRMPKTDSDLLEKALLKFGRDTKEGKQFLISTGFGSIVPATTKDMNSLDRYVAETKQLLNESN